MFDPNVILSVNAAATLFMTGVIWIVQIVHYPLMANVGDEGYHRYQQLHEQSITWVVMPPMLVEVFTAVLLITHGSHQFATWKLWAGLVLLGIIWLSTFCLQVPQHSALGGGFDSVAHARLVSTNWIRTIAWTFRSALAGWMIYETMVGSINGR